MLTPSQSTTSERPGRRTSDRLMRMLARLLIHVFFREVEVDGAERFPTEGPVVVVANHQNGLVDGLLLMTALSRYPRLLGKSTLWKILPLRPFLALAGVVPVYRAADGAGTDRNREAFGTSRRILADGHVLAVFPEGISHDEASLQPLRTGAARIALGAAVEDAIPGVVCVPAGLTYDAKSRFRSRALVRLGAPISLEQWSDAYAADDRSAVRALTDRLASELEAVSPTYASWQQSRAANRMAEICARTGDRAVADRAVVDRAGPVEVGPVKGGPVEVALVDQERIARRLASVESARPDVVRALREASDTYERDLALLGLSDRQITTSYDARRVRWAMVWEGGKVAGALPLAVVGVVLHAVPYQVVKQLAKKPANEGIKATVKVLGCFVGFLVVYIAAAVVVGRSFGLAAGVAAFIVGPLSGYVTVRLAERVIRLGGLVEGYRRVRQGRMGVAAALADRQELVREVAAVLDLAGRTSGESDR